MAESKSVTKLDQKLMDEGILDPAFKNDYKKVHTMLNSHIKKTGKILSEDTFQEGDKKLREWLLTLYKKGASQEKLSSYLRCGLAHLSFDYIDSTYQIISIEDLLTRALQSFKKRNYHKSFFKAAVSKTKKTASKKTAQKKTTVKKKSTAKKKAAKKKTTTKTASKKKTVKKSSVKKSSAKKSVKKKTTPKKKTTTKKKSKTKKKEEKSFIDLLLGR
jgi:hypothetical protein